jgi:hypothetical protein
MLDRWMHAGGLLVRSAAQFLLVSMVTIFCHHGQSDLHHDLFGDAGELGTVVSDDHT